MKEANSDQDLIKGCIKKDPRCQQALYEKYAPKMFGICLRYANDHPGAEDLMQEGFIKVFSNIIKFRFEGSFEGWMKRIFVNTAIEHYRRHVNMYPISEVRNQSTEEGIHSAMAADDLLAILHSLSVGYRTIFNLYAIEGYSHKEIAKKLQISEGTSKSQLARARNILQKMVTSFEKVEEKALYVGEPN